MKVLVDSQNGNIQGVYNTPLKFSISGKYVIDVPPEVGNITIGVDPLVLIAAKQSALMSLHPTLLQTIGDEFLDISLIDQALSSRAVVAPNKGMVIMPGGSVMTTIMALLVPDLSVVSVIYHGFLLNRDIQQVPDQTEPSPILYGWDPTSSSFVDFGPGVFQVDVMDSTGSVVLVADLQTGVEYPYLDSTPLDVRLRFTSLVTIPWYLSDYLLLVGGSGPPVPPLP